MVNLTENQKKWIAALRSGKYEQGTEVLESNTGFCCLGVGCKVAEENGVEVIIDEFGVLIGDTLSKQPKVKDWLGLNTCGGTNKDILRLSLIALNDVKCKTFEEIANTLETVPGYFVEN